MIHLALLLFFLFFTYKSLNVNRPSFLSFRWLICLTCLLALISEATAVAPATSYEHHFYTFGTEITILIHQTDPVLAKAAAQEVEDLFSRLNRELNPWQPGPLMKLNQALNLTGRAKPEPTTLLLIEQAQALYHVSQGRFNAALGKVITLWRFDQAVHSPQRPPEESRLLQAIRPQISPLDVRIDSPWVYALRPGVFFDFGGMAKGHALDQGIELLRSHGIENAVINGGGDLKTLGHGPQGAWRIGIRHPRGDGAVAAIRPAGGEGVFTSGDYERYFEHDGQRFHHIMDPKTGQPAVGIVSATVVSTNGLLADAAATAIIAAGPDHWVEMARSLGVEKVLVIDHNLTIYLSTALQAQTEVLEASLPLQMISLSQPTHQQRNVGH